MQPLILVGCILLAFVVPMEPVKLPRSYLGNLGESRAASEDDIIHSGPKMLGLILPLLATSITIESFVPEGQSSSLNFKLPHHLAFGH